MRWLYKLENKFGRYYIPRLMLVVVIGMAAVYLLDMTGAVAGFNFSQMLSLDRAMILQGQVWRLITFVFVPPSTQAFWLLINLYVYYMMGSMLESYWGGFRLNVYYLCGILGAILACFLVGYGYNTYLNLSLFLAFATIAPDTQFRLFFLIPIKAKWLAIAYAVMLGLELFFLFIASPTAGLISLASLGLSLLNYAIFFGPQLVTDIKDAIRVARNRRNWRNGKGR